MNIGKQLRRGFELMAGKLGSTIIVHKNWNTSSVKSFEVRGLKNNKKDRASDVMFQFLEDPGISVGDVLQQSKSRDLWRVIEISDKVIDDVYQYFEACVENMGASSRTPQGPSTSHNVVVHGNVLGGIQVASPGSIQNNSAQFSNIEKDLRQLRDLFVGSTLSPLDREEAAHLLSRIDDLTTKPKSSDVLTKIGGKIDELRKLATNVTALTVTAGPVLTGLWDKLQAAFSQ